MTESDWILLTNRPGVVEKEIIKLLDWFIKEGILHIFGSVFLEQKLNYVCPDHYHNYN